ncbi:hypothetical protein ZB36_08900 [Salmonella enterica subsp. enterica]|nr:hypothetical protein [Salmonella enterica subsp. enterica serovar Sandiego]EDV5378390.1 hypothetical protein [Salmonella enterica subsp. enterica serovar Sandiego]EDW2377018.1 hypothetical protein [Salmonella enterica subsp. enterica serovar Sandiego]
MASAVAIDSFFLSMRIITEYRVPKKLTPLEELRLMKARFISFGEAMDWVRAKNPDMTLSQAAEWIVAKAYRRTRIVKHLLAGNTVPVTPDELEKDVTDGDWISSYGFIRSELEWALGMNLPVHSLAACHQDNVYDEEAHNSEPEGAETTSASGVGDGQLPANDGNSIEWDMSAGGMDTALNIISGLAVALGKTSEIYRRGGKLNISGLANCAERNLKQFGGGFQVGDRWVRKLLTRALERCLPEMENEASHSEKIH